jgi:hypothetical protein
MSIFKNLPLDIIYIIVCKYTNYFYLKIDKLIEISLISKDDYKYDILRKIKLKKYNAGIDETCISIDIKTDNSDYKKLLLLQTINITSNILFNDNLQVIETYTRINAFAFILLHHYIIIFYL